MKKNIYSLMVFLICTTLSVNLLSQNLKPISNSSAKAVNHEFCGADFFHEEKMKMDIGYRNRYLQIKDQIQQLQLQKNPVNGIYQVPVVVHVMHKGEDVGTGTNISDEDVKLGIQYLNNFWRKVAGSVGDGDGVDMQIEFTLAIQDEGGNCTDGIDRVDMSGVTEYVNNGVRRSTSGIADYNGDAPVNSLKEYSIWDPTEFYNVWLVDEIDNANCYSGGSYTAGYAYYSSAHGQPYDGSVVLICSYLNGSDVTWAHEMGHAFNLPHTFDGDNDGANCGDDGISDTPAHKRTSSFDPSIYFDCSNTDANSCDASFNQEINPETGFRRNTGTHQDHMHNYMDYTGCATEFTGGQRTVAIAAMTGARASFLSGYALTPPLPATVDFSSAASIACTGSSIVFTDESTCTPNTYTNTGYTGISFLWTFDDGINTPITSTDQNPSITFNTPGTYSVTLEVTNPQGTTSKTKTNYITVTAGATAASCSPNLGTNFGNYNHTIWNVEFNTINNTTSTSSNGDDGYEDFSCSINTTLEAGSSYDLSLGVKASNFGYDEEFCVWIDWDNSGTFETSNGDGINEKVFSGNTPENTTNTFTQSITVPASAVQNTLLRMRVYGEANILTDNEMLCVSGSFFIGDVEDYGILIQPATVAPVADFSASSTSVCEGVSVSFTDLSTESPTSWSWSFGDGGTSTAQNPSHTYATPGTYTVTLTATNAGGSDNEIKNNHITVNINPDLSSTSSTGETCAGNDGTATVSPGAGTYTYSWNTAPVQTTSTATGLAAGTYNVTVTNTSTTCFASTDVVVADGCVGTAPVADFSANSTSVCEGGSVSFTDLSTESPTSWSWDFGDGSTSTAQNPSHTYATAGTYTVTLTATNAGGSDDEIKNNHITVNANPDLSSTSSTDETCTGNDGTATVSPGAGTYTYSWNTAPVQTTSTATGLAAGTYNVTVTNTSTTCFASTDVVVADGCVGTAPVADFSANSTSVCEGGSVSFTDLSTESPTSWSWSFAGGTPATSTSPNPTVTYNTPGTFSVTLTSTNASGSDGETKVGYITVNQASGPELATTQIRVQDCGITLNSASKIIYADPVVGATYYQFKVTNNSLGFSYETKWWHSARWLRLMSIPGIQTNTAYDVQVRLRTSACDSSSYGSVCEIISAGNPVLNTQVITTQCGTTQSNINTPIYAKPIAGATSYTFEISNSSLGFLKTITIGWRHINLSWWGNLIQPNTTYNIKVKATVNGVVGNYGVMCQISTPSSVRLGDPYTDEEIRNLVENKTPLDLIIYPNPNQGEYLYVELVDLSPNSELIVTDIYGKQVEKMIIDTEESNYNTTVRFTNKLTSGFYLVTVKSNGQSITKKLIVR